MAQTLNKDIFQSSFTWNLEDFCTMFTPFNTILAMTKQIPIQGLPFNWQLGITGVFSTQSIYFNLDFFNDGPVSKKYTKISCEFKIGSYWSGTADLFPANVWRVTAWVSMSTLKADISRRGSLGIECHMTFSAYFREGKPSEHTIEDSKSCATKLNKDIGVLLENEKHSDVTIVVKDQEFKAHKFILAARSPVFSLMLATDMKEKIESRIEIRDVSVEAVRAFLKFLYTAEVSSTPHSKDLLSLAAMYQIEDLNDACGRMLVTQLNKGNALENLFLANLHNCEELKQKAFKIITQQILSETIPDHLMNKPEAVEKLVLIKIKYDDTLQEVKNM